MEDNTMTPPTASSDVGVTFELSEGRTIRLGLGAMIGRGRNADLQLVDPRVSVAHAGIGLRAGGLWLLTYRGRVWVEGALRGDIPLQEGQRIELAPGIGLRVMELHVPQMLTTLTVGGVAFTVDHAVWHIDEAGALRPGSEIDRPMMWEAHGTWYASAPEGRTRDLPVGEDVDLAGHLVRLDRKTPSDASTRQTVEELAPIEVRCHADETEIRIADRAPARLRRTSHLVFQALGRLTATTGRPVHWMVLAQAVWTAPNQLERLETLWPQKRKRLYQELQDEGLPTWLLRTEGGLVQLGLRPDDRFHDCDPASR